MMRKNVFKYTNVHPYVGDGMDESAVALVELQDAIRKHIQENPEHDHFKKEIRISRLADKIVAEAKIYNADSMNWVDLIARSVIACLLYILIHYYWPF